MPTDEQRALWAAIRANPDDDTPRLVYADWLQENGDEARAEFIRLQCGLPQLSPSSEVLANNRSSDRVGELLNAHRDQWCALLRSTVIGEEGEHRSNRIQRIRFRRGFVFGLDLNWRMVTQLVRSKAEIEPMFSARLSDTTTSYDRALVVSFVNADHARDFAALSVVGSDDGVIDGLTRSTQLSNLEHLAMQRGAITDTGVRALTGWPCAVSLWTLDLSSNPISDDGALFLARCTLFQRLTRLDLQQTRISPIGQRWLRERFGSRVVLESEP
jgi:uncharacterized protein (TIGR02996 family)